MTANEKPLLILDLDETLIHAAHFVLDRAPDMVLAHYFVYFRPHVKEFLAQCHENYQVGIWSSATINYITPIARALWGQLPEPLFVWDRARCTIRYDFHKDEEFFIKDLRKVEVNGIMLNRVLMVDDELRKVSFQHANAICIERFVGDLADSELIHLGKYLDSIAQSKDFRKVDKSRWRQQADYKRGDK